MCPAGLDNNLFILDKTGFVEALAVCGHEGCLRLGRTAIDELLRGGGKSLMLYPRMGLL